MVPPPEPPLSRPLHTKYFLRCLRAHLPTAYTPTDAQRMTLAFFILSALDLLGALQSSTTEEERRGFVEWIYRCQHPSGGFRGFTGACIPASSADEEGEGNKWDPANLAATYFALASLAVLGDGLSRVRREECLSWIKGMQFEDGSFGEVMIEGKAEGGRDVRFCYCAAVVRWMLGGGKEEGGGDIDIDGLVGFITRSQTYDGGIAKAPFHEAHAGETYCGIATLALLGRLPAVYANNTSSNESVNTDGTSISEEFIEPTIRWLVYRQTSIFREEDDGEYTLSEEEMAHHQSHLGPISDTQSALPHLPEPPHTTPHHLPETTHLDLDAPHATLPPAAFHGTPPLLLPTAHHQTPPQPFSQTLTILPDYLLWAGFNGRCNKIADTCYSFWVGGTLSILNHPHLPSHPANRRFLLEKTQHAIGGFGKNAGDLPDILHSYLALAALAAHGDEPGLKTLDAMLCVSLDVKGHLDRLRTGFGVAEEGLRG